MKYIILTALLTGLWWQADAQDYERAIGVRAGITPGLTYTRFVTDALAMEGLISFRRGGIQLTITRQFHNPLIMGNIDNLFFYFGYGLHAGYSTWSRSEVVINGQRYRKRSPTIGAGVDGVVGFEYHFLKYPLAIALEYKPYAEIAIPKHLYSNNYESGLRVTYTIN